MITSLENTMTTNRVRRDRHPARSARILSTGIALTATFGLTSAYGISARAQQPQEPIVPPTDGTQTDSLQSLSTSPLVAPSNPAPALPATTVPTASETPSPVSSAAPVATTAPATLPPVATTIPVQVVVPVWTPPQTSGSN